MQATLASILLGGIAEIKKDALVSHVFTDSREKAAGGIFICIKGGRQDGHSFAKDVLASGALYAVCEYLPDNAQEYKERCLIVDNTLDALITIGGNYSAQFDCVTFAVTGSVGKTTTKEFCYSILSAQGKTIKTEGNENNELGMPKTLFKIDASTRYAVVEMGMQGLGEISKLTRAARPGGAIITCIGRSHLLQLGSRENILKAKLEICEGLRKNAPLALNGDDEYLQHAAVPSGINTVVFGIKLPCEVQASNIEAIDGETRFIIYDKLYGHYNVQIPALGIHNVYNALAAYTLTTRMGIPAQTAAKALSDFSTVGQRQKITHFHDIDIIEDCYNANPDSMGAALTVLRDYTAFRRVAVLGDMLELGECSRAEHEQIGRLAAQSDVDYLITVGEEARYIHERATGFGVNSVHCMDNKDAVDLLAFYAKKGDAVLVKASRGMHFEEIINGFYESKDKELCE